MKGLRDSHFIPRWRALYDSTNPGRTKEKWTIDGVEWTRVKHSCFAADHSFQIEIHTLTHRSSGSGSWAFIVVIEHWWGADRSSEIRFGEWCRLLSGRAENVVQWLKRHAVE
jgi:hypothetical protein